MSYYFLIFFLLTHNAIMGQYNLLEKPLKKSISLNKILEYDIDNLYLKPKQYYEKKACNTNVYKKDNYLFFLGRTKNDKYIKVCILNEESKSFSILEKFYANSFYEVGYDLDKIIFRAIKYKVKSYATALYLFDLKTLEQKSILFKKEKIEFIFKDKTEYIIFVELVGHKFNWFFLFPHSGPKWNTEYLDRYKIYRYDKEWQLKSYNLMDKDQYLRLINEIRIIQFPVLPRMK